MHTMNSSGHVSSGSFGPATIGQGHHRPGYPDPQAKNSVFSNALSSPVRRSLQHYHLAQGSYNSSNATPSANGARIGETNFSIQHNRESNSSSSVCWHVRYVSFRVAILYSAVKSVEQPKKENRREGQSQLCKSKATIRIASTVKAIVDERIGNGEVSNKQDCGLHQAVTLCLKIQKKHGKLLKDFNKGLVNNKDIEDLKAAVEKFSSSFDMPGFLMSEMKYKD
ncbi:hypothetical protein Syun_006215 [Stephania yunnanensis]|uniref:Uncharacterized protein n=1 Tax=Stephania yunnanensis TaxID=152371 RepID=A0AAP0KXU3_9MAGN